MQSDSTTKTNQPRVTAIIIFLNAEQYLPEAIESVFDQTYTDWELLLCDDGSTDKSTIYAKRFAEAYPDKVRYLEHEDHANRGMSASRELGVKHARGEFVSWLDADDVWRANKLQRQTALLDEHPDAALVYGPVESWYSWSGKPEDQNRDFLQDISVTPDTMQEPTVPLMRLLESDNYIPCGVMVRRSILEEVGFETSFRGAFEDVIVTSKICLKYPVYASSESWYRYRQHEIQYCAELRRSYGKRRARLVFLDCLLKHIELQCLDSSAVAQRVRELLEKNKDTPIKTAREFVLRNIKLARMLTKQFLLKVRGLMRYLLPRPVRGIVGKLWYGSKSTPARGWVDFGVLHRTKPISYMFGWDRGKPADRYYVENFIESHREDIRGRALEIGEARYINEYGKDRVTQIDVLHAHDGNPHATIIGDLSTGENIPREAFDCMILTQVFGVIWDVRTAIRHAAEALKPGGVMLVTLPGITQISTYDTQRWGDYWRFTGLSARRLFEEHFPPDCVTVESFGNVLVASSFLFGLSADELSPSELNDHDPNYEVTIAVRVQKPL